MRPHLHVALLLCLVLMRQSFAFYPAPMLYPSSVSTAGICSAAAAAAADDLSMKKVDHRRRLDAGEHGNACWRQKVPRGRSLQLYSGVGSIAAPPPPTQVTDIIEREKANMNMM